MRRRTFKGQYLSIVDLREGRQEEARVEDLTASVDTLDRDKQNVLVSGVNIKTVNGSSLLGSGDLVISGGLTQPQVMARTLGC